MNRRPDFLPLSEDHLLVEVSVSVPWLDERLNYRHAFDHPGIREEFGPLPQIFDPFDMHRRSQIMERRRKSVEAISHTIARSILDAMAKEKP